jgi:hypothetical protein
VPIDLALAAILLLAPLVRHFVEEGCVDEAVKLVDIHGVNAILKPFVRGLVPLNGFIVLAPLVGMAGVQRIAHPLQHLVVELHKPQQFGELLFQHLLAHIATAAGSRVALANIGDNTLGSPPPVSGSAGIVPSSTLIPRPLAFIELEQRPVNAAKLALAAWPRE